MSEILVSKFGGDAMRPTSVRSVAEIAAHPERSIITASAPFGVTDSLVNYINTGNPTDLLPIFETFRQTADSADNSVADRIAEDAINELSRLPVANRHRILACGERFSGRLLAHMLEVPYVEPLHFSDSTAQEVDRIVTGHHLSAALKMSSKIVAGAFFGHNPDGEIVTMGRNMSDVSGAIFTNLSGAEMYENWKRVAGIYQADPRIVARAAKLNEITYTEVRELGGQFLHRNAVMWLEDMDITTHIRSFENPEQNGTCITDKRNVNHGELVHSIAISPDMRYFRIHETGMNDAHGELNRITSFFNDWGVSVDHVPSGIDTVAIVANNNQFGEKIGQVNLEEFVNNLRQYLPEKAALSTKHVAIIYLVGHGMELNGNLARLEHLRAGALIDAKIQLLGSETQPENPMSFCLVPPERANEALKAFSDRFFGNN